MGKGNEKKPSRYQRFRQQVRDVFGRSSENVNALSGSRVPTPNSAYNSGNPSSISLHIAHDTRDESLSIVESHAGKQNSPGGVNPEFGGALAATGPALANPTLPSSSNSRLKSTAPVPDPRGPSSRIPVVVVTSEPPPPLQVQPVTSADRSNPVESVQSSNRVDPVVVQKEPPAAPPTQNQEVAKARESIWSTVEDLRNAQKTFVKNRLVYRDRHNKRVDVVERMGRILKCVEDYARIVDVAIQHSPEITALVWAGARFLLNIAVNATQYLKALEVILATVVEKMATIEFYAFIYRGALLDEIELDSTETTKAFATRLGSALKQLYEAVGDLVDKAKVHFLTNNPVEKIVNLFRPFSTYIKPYMDAVLEKEKVMEGLAGMATMKRTMDGGLKLNELKELVAGIKAQTGISVAKLDDILILTQEHMNLTKNHIHVMEAATTEIKERLAALHDHQSEILQSTSLDPELQNLKSRYLDDAEVTMRDFDLGLYIATRGMSRPDAPEETHFDLYDTLQQFLRESNTQKICLIQGAAGSGKSTFNHYLARQLWNKCASISCESAVTIPLFISLASMDGVGTRDDLIARYFTERGWSTHQIQIARQTLRFIFILDGYDELEKRSGNFYMDNKLGNWKTNCKVIITSRPEYLNQGYQSMFYPSRDQQNMLKEYWIAPFTTSSIKQFITKYVSINPDPDASSSKAYYDNLISKPEIRELISNPFLLRMVVSVRPETSVEVKRLKRATLYRQFLEHWFSQAHVRLNTIKLPEQQRDIFSKLCECEERFTIQLQYFCQAFALELYRHHSLEATYIPPSSDLYSNFILQPQKRSVWERFLNSDDRTRLIRFSCPLTRNKHSYRFLHKSLRDYLVAQSLWENLLSYFQRESESPLLLLNEFSIIKDPGVIDFFVEYAEDNVALQDSLLTCIEESKTNSEMAKAAANAITILVRAGKRFVEHDLRGIRVPGADLEGGFFDRARLQHADLSRVRFPNVWLREADLSEAQVDNAWWAVVPSYLTPHNESDRLRERCYFIYAYFHTTEGELLAAGSQWRGDNNYGGNDVFLWSVTKRRLVHIFSGDHHTTGPSTAVAFSSDGALLASSGDKGVALWSIHDLRLVHEFPSADGCASMCVTFARDDQLLLMGDLKGRVFLWSVASYQLLHTFRRGIPVSPELEGRIQLRVSYLASSPNGKMFAVGSDLRGSVSIWSISDYHFAHSLQHPSGDDDNMGVRALAFSPDGRFLATCYNDGTVCLWSVTDEFQLLNTSHILTHMGYISRAAISFSPNSELLAVAPDSSSLRLWSVQNQQLWSREVSSHRILRPKTLAFSPDNQFIICSSDIPTTTINGAEWTAVLKLKVQEQYQPVSQTSYSDERAVSGLAFLSGDSTFVTAAPNWALRVESTTPLGHLFHHKPWIHAKFGDNEHHSSFDPVFSPDRELIAVMERYRTEISLWSRLTSERLHVLTGHRDYVECVAFSPDSTMVASGSSDKTVRLWSVVELRCIHVLAGHRGDVQCVAFSPDGNMVASGSSDETVRLWSVVELCCIHVFEGHTAPVMDIAFSPDGTMVASGSDSRDRTVRLWSVMKLCCINVFIGHDSFVNAVAFSPDGTMLASTSYDRTVQLWSVVDLRRMHVLEHSDSVESVAFSPDGVFVAAAIARILYLWSSQEGKCVKKLDCYSHITCFTWGSASRSELLLVGTTRGLVQLWRVRQQGNHTTAEHLSVDMSCLWSSIPLLNLRDVNIQGVTGIHLGQMQVLKDRGAIGEPAGVRVEELTDDED